MNWYYAVAGERKGPVDAEEFQRLVQSGVITAQTLVWREGMAGWQPHQPQAVASPEAPPVQDVRCAECGQGFTRGDVIELANQFYCGECKPVVVQRLREGVPVSTAAEEMRNQYLKHEASVQSAGTLYILSGIMMAVAVFVLLIPLGSFGFSAALVVFYSVFGVALVAVGTGVRRLLPWARVPAGLISGLGLLGFPLGTLINAYILYLIFCRKGKVVFSDEYRSVIAQTPHIKYRTSRVAWAIAIVFVLLILVAIFGVFFRATR